MFAVEALVGLSLVGLAVLSSLECALKRCGLLHLAWRHAGR